MQRNDHSPSSSSSSSSVTPADTGKTDPNQRKYNDLVNVLKEFLVTENQFHEDMGNFSKVLTTVGIEESIVAPYSFLANNSFPKYSDLVLTNDKVSDVNTLLTAIMAGFTGESDKAKIKFDEKDNTTQLSAHFDKSLQAIDHTNQTLVSFFNAVKCQFFGKEASKPYQRSARYRLLLEQIIANLKANTSIMGTETSFDPTLMKAIEAINNTLKPKLASANEKMVIAEKNPIIFAKDEFKKIVPFGFLEDFATALDSALYKNANLSETERASAKKNNLAFINEQQDLLLNRKFTEAQQNMRKKMIILYLDQYIEGRSKVSNHTKKADELLLIEEMLVNQQTRAYEIGIPWIINNEHNTAILPPKEKREVAIFAEMSKLKSSERAEVLQHLHSKVNGLLSNLSVATFTAVKDAKEDQDAHIKLIADYHRKIINVFKALERMAPGDDNIAKKEWNRLVMQNAHSKNVPTISEGKDKLDENLLERQIIQRTEVDREFGKLARFNNEINKNDTLLNTILPPKAVADLNTVNQAIFQKGGEIKTSEDLTCALIKIYLDAYLKDRTRIKEPGIFGKVKKVKGTYLQAVEAYICQIEGLQNKKSEPGYIVDVTSNDDKDKKEVAKLFDAENNKKEEVIFERVGKSFNKDKAIKGQLLHRVVDYLFQEVVKMRNDSETPAQQLQQPLINAFKALARMGDDAKKYWHSLAAKNAEHNYLMPPKEFGWGENDIEKWIGKFSPQPSSTAKESKNLSSSSSSSYSSKK